MSDLLRQQCQQLLHVDTDVIRALCLIGLTSVKIIREDNALHQCDDLLHLLYRRQRSLGGRHHAHLLFRMLRHQCYILLQHPIHGLLVYHFLSSCTFQGQRYD